MKHTKTLALASAALMALGLAGCTASTQTLRGFLNDNVLHSPDTGDIHYSSYIPARYDGSTPAARLSPTTPP